MRFPIEGFISSIFSLIYFAKVNLTRDRVLGPTFELYLMKIWSTKALQLFIFPDWSWKMGAYMCVLLIGFKLAVSFWKLVLHNFHKCLFTSLSWAKQRLLNQTSISSISFFITKMNKVILYGNLNAYQTWEAISTTIKPFVRSFIYYYIITTRVIHLSFHRELQGFFFLKLWTQTCHVYARQRTKNCVQLNSLKFI